MDVWVSLEYLRSRQFLLWSQLLLLVFSFGAILTYHLRNQHHGQHKLPFMTHEHKASTIGNESTHQPRFKMCSSFCEAPTNFAEPEMFHSMDRAAGNGGTSCVLVYSAYFDKRYSAIKVLTDSDLKCYQSVAATCHIWYERISDPYVTRLTFEFMTLEEAAYNPRLGVVYYCSTPKDLEEQPYAVSFIWDGADNQRLQPLSMKVHRSQPPLYTFATCVPPLFGDIRPERLIEFIEFHRILGAEKFYFYNDSISDQCSNILLSYARQGLVQLINWKSIYPSMVKYQNQQLMHIDCMYRNLHQTKYVAQIDVDEALLTHNGNDWREMVRKVGTSDTAAFVFLNRFYALDESRQCPRPNLTETGEPSGFVSTSLRRLAYHDIYYKPDVRSKILYRPDAVHRVRTHYPHPLPGYKIVAVDHSVGSLNHYRKEYEPAVSTKGTILDDSMCIYSETLESRVRKIMKQTMQSTNRNFDNNFFNNFMSTAANR